MFRALRHDDRGSAGFSLVELAVYIVVLGIISTIIATLVISLFRSEQTVSGISSASNDSQIVSATLTNDIRNARAFKVTNNQVIASVAGSGTNLEWKCVRWAVSATSKVLTREVKPDTGTVPTWGAGTALGSDVDRVQSSPYFSGGSVAAEAGTAVAALQYNFAFRTTGDGNVTASGQVSNRVASTGTRCW